MDMMPIRVPVGSGGDEVYEAAKAKRGRTTGRRNSSAARKSENTIYGLFARPIPGNLTRSASYIGKNHPQGRLLAGRRRRAIS